MQIDQAIIDRVAAALETVDMGHSMSLTRLVNDVHTYTLTIRGEVETFVDNDDADAIDQVYARIREVKYRLQAEAIIAALSATTPKGVTRYDLVDFDMHGSSKIMEPTVGGDWVKWEDIDPTSSSSRCVETVLRECEEYFDQRADADLSTGVPDEEMKLLLAVREALKAITA